MSGRRAGRGPGRVLAGAVALSFPLLVGWSHPLSPEAFFSVDDWVTYQEVAEDPEAHEGRTLMLAGRIAAVTRDRDGTTLEIRCYTRDPDDRPVEPDPQCGTFLAHAPQLLPEDRYQPGRLVTLTGTVAGAAGRPAAGPPDLELLPLFRVGEIRLWPSPRPEDERRRPARGYERFCDPFWDRWCSPFRDPWCDPYWPSHRSGWRCWY